MSATDAPPLGQSVAEAWGSWFPLVNGGEWTVEANPGTIDADYRGEVQVILANLGAEAFTVTRGMRIAQMVVASYARVEWQEVAELPSSARGTGGFGSTGIKAAKTGGA